MKGYRFPDWQAQRHAGSWHSRWTQPDRGVDPLSPRDPQGRRVWKLPLWRAAKESVAGERDGLYIVGRVVAFSRS